MPTTAPLYFKDAPGAFEYARRYTPSELAPGRNALGIVVLDTMDKAGQQVLIIRLADLEQTEVAGIPISSKLNIKAGDLVIYRLEKTLPEIPPPFNTFGVVGAKVAPEWSVEGGWKLIDVPGVYSKQSLAFRLGQRIGRMFGK